MVNPFPSVSTVIMLGRELPCCKTLHGMIIMTSTLSRFEYEKSVSLNVGNNTRSSILVRIWLVS